ncbi:MAG TPA: hypothetical protein VF472_23790 [Burkholderiaceae bacterium]
MLRAYEPESEHAAGTPAAVADTRHPPPARAEERGPLPPRLPPPLRAGMSGAPTTMAPRRALPGTPAAQSAAAQSASRRDRLAGADLPVAGYLLARASVGRKVDDPRTIQALRKGQYAEERAIAALHLGRGNVVDDLYESNGESYVAIQLQRDAAAFLRRSVDYQSPPGAPTPLSLRMSRLSHLWPEGFGEALRTRFPDPEAAEGAVLFIAKVIAARHFGAGNCGEHARTVAQERMRMDDAHPNIRVAHSSLIDHAWAESMASASALSDEDVIMDGWMRTVAHLREDSHYGAAAQETSAQFSGENTQRWMSAVIAHIERALRKEPVLNELTAKTERLVRDKVAEQGISGAEDAVPVNLRPDFMVLARERARGRPALSQAIEAAGVGRSLGQSIAAATNTAGQQAMMAARAAILNRQAPEPLPDVPEPDMPEPDMPESGDGL